MARAPSLSEQMDEHDRNWEVAQAMRTAAREEREAALPTYGKLEAKIILLRAVLMEAQVFVPHTGDQHGLAARIVAALER